MDLDEYSEFRRSTYEFPVTVDRLESEKETLKRRRQIPHGWISRTYECRRWENKEGWSIPLEAQFTHRTYGSEVNETATIVATSTHITDECGPLSAPPITERTYIRDYRYTRRTRERFFPYAEYVEIGRWRGDTDPELFAQAEAYLKHGPKIGSVSWFDPRYKGRIQVIWLALVLVSVAVLGVMMKHKRKYS